jgi:hypothetical protein
MGVAAKKEEQSYTPTKPRLGGGPVYRFITLSDRLYKAGEQTVELQAQALDLEEKELAELVRAHTEKLQEAAKRAQESGVWSYMQKIGSAILSTISIFLGISLGATAATAAIGTALVAVGIFGLAHLAFQEAGFWDWIAEKIAQDNEELKRKIQTYVPLVIGLLVNGAQLAAFWAFPVYSALDLPAKILLIAQTLSNSATIVSAIGGQVSEALVAKAKADALSLQGDMQISKYEVERITHGIEMALSSQTEAYKAAKHIVDLTVEANHQILLA